MRHPQLSEWYWYWGSQAMKVLANTEYCPILANIKQYSNSSIVRTLVVALCVSFSSDTYSSECFCWLLYNFSDVNTASYCCNMLVA